MNQVVILNRQEQERLLRTIESAVHVRRRHQFFLWAQGQLFGLLPHELLICLRLERGNGATHVECLHSGLFSNEQEAHLCHPQSGLAVRLARSCEEAGLLPGLVAASSGAHDLIFREYRADMEQAGLRNAVVHGNRINGQNDASFFVMCNLEGQVAPVHSHLMQLLLPHMHMAFHHAISNEESPAADSRDGSPSRAITDRERQILQWVSSGKSNCEIGSILDISTLTVKNHMKKIFKKLNVHNRAQAVSRGMSLRMFDDRN